MREMHTPIAAVAQVQILCAEVGAEAKTVSNQNFIIVLISLLFDTRPYSKPVLSSPHHISDNFKFKDPF